MVFYQLQCGKVVRFTDKNVDNDGYQIFEYVGQIVPLNQYLVSGGYWESGDYKMIDKNSGEDDADVYRLSSYLAQ